MTNILPHIFQPILINIGLCNTALRKNDQDPTYICKPGLKEQSFNYHKNWLVINGEKNKQNQKKYQRLFWLRQFMKEGLINQDVLKDLNEENGKI